jgi:hypothetical protein
MIGTEFTSDPPRPDLPRQGVGNPYAGWRVDTPIAGLKMEILGLDPCVLQRTDSSTTTAAFSTRPGRASGCGVGILGAAPEQPQQDLAGPAGLL